MSDTLEGIPIERVVEHRDKCAFCQQQVALCAKPFPEGAEAKFRLLRHIVRFFNGPKDFLEPCKP